MQSKNKVIIAVAGAGKTYQICDLASKNERRQLILTYTNKGVYSIINELKKQNNGIIPENICVRSWYSFLLSEFVKPYQNKMTKIINGIVTIDFSNMYGRINYNKRGTKEYYMTNNSLIKANYVSAFAIDCNLKSGGLSLNRLEDIYDTIYIDEIQDLAGEDLEIVKLLINSKIKCVLVGDYRQKTFSTHNSNKNKKISGINILNLFNSLEKEGLLSIEYSNHSRRCNSDICAFANNMFDDDFKMISNNNLDIENKGVFLILKDDAEKYINKYFPAILKYDNNTKTMLYDSLNFGQCKGMTFERIAIFPNKTFIEFLKGKAIPSPSKYYVAATRARHSVVFIVDKFFKTNLFVKDEIILCNNEKIEVLRFIS